MKAKGDVPVGCPVTAAGEATASARDMVGIAGRVPSVQHSYRDGEEFQLVTDKACLIHLPAAMDLIIGGIDHRLSPYDQNYVTLKAGKIVDFEGRQVKGR